LRSNSKIASDQRAKEPTIFEYYRKEKNVPLTTIDGINSVAPDSASYGGVGYLSWQKLIGNEWVVKAKAVE
jgi:hypothetical protein